MYDVDSHQTILPDLLKEKNMLYTEITVVRKKSSQIQTLTTTFIKLLANERKSLIKSYIKDSIWTLFFLQGFWFLCQIWWIYKLTTIIYAIKKDSKSFCFIAIQAVLLNKKTEEHDDGIGAITHHYYIYIEVKNDLPIFGKNIETQLVNQLNNTMGKWPARLRINESIYPTLEEGMPLSILVGLHSNYWYAPELGKNHLGSDFFNNNQF